MSTSGNPQQKVAQQQQVAVTTTPQQIAATQQVAATPTVQQQQATQQQQVVVPQQQIVLVETSDDVSGETSGNIMEALGVIVGVLLVILTIYIVLTIFGLKTRNKCKTGQNQSKVLSIGLLISVLMMWFTPVSPGAAVATLIMIIVGGNTCR